MKNKIACFVLAFFAPATFASSIESCWQASMKSREVEPTSLIIDDDRKYIAYKKLMYGVKGNDENGFFKINGVDFDVSKVKYVFIKSGKYVKNIGRNDLDMLQGEALEVGRGSKSSYCLVLPFNGLGASGSFSNYMAVISVPKLATRNKDVMGFVGSIRVK